MSDKTITTPTFISKNHYEAWLKDAGVEHTKERRDGFIAGWKACITAYREELRKAVTDA